MKKMMRKATMAAGFFGFILAFHVSPALAQVPVEITPEILTALQNDPEMDPEVLKIILMEIIPAIQADPHGAEAQGIRNLAEAICRGEVNLACSVKVDEKSWKAFREECCREIERPEREHDHSSHDHGAAEREHQEHEHEG